MAVTHSDAVPCFSCPLQSSSSMEHMNQSNPPRCPETSTGCSLRRGKVPVSSLQRFFLVFLARAPSLPWPLFYSPKLACPRLTYLLPGPGPGPGSLAEQLSHSASASTAAQASSTTGEPASLTSAGDDSTPPTTTASSTKKGKKPVFDLDSLRIGATPTEVQSPVRKAPTKQAESTAMSSSPGSLTAFRVPLNPGSGGVPHQNEGTIATPMEGVSDSLMASTSASVPAAASAAASASALAPSSAPSSSSSSAPASQLPGELVRQQLQVGPLRCGGSIQAAARMADIRAAAARRRARTASSSNGGGAPSSSLGMPPLEDGTSGSEPKDSEVSIPNAFSLSSLGFEKSSMDEVAQFATDPSKKDDSIDDSSFKFDKSCFTKMRIIGQFNLGFIIAALEAKGEAGGPQLFIIDQHASDEKFRFEGLNRDSKIERQPLVAPHQLQLTPAQEAIVEANLEVFRQNGFELTLDPARPPGRRLRMKSLPTCQGLVFSEKDLHDLIHTLEESESQQSLDAPPPMQAPQSTLLDIAGHRALWRAGSLPRPSKVWQLLACKACRGAIMIGKALRPAEMQRVLRNLSKLEQPWNCPHGRPTLRHLVDAGVVGQRAPAAPPLPDLLEAQGAGVCEEEGEEE
uniref:PMS1-like protein n=1 Tax=Crypthecodinium cohnii TaxID=2866 RepID=A0A516AGK3_CRYCO|nr:PMS1-like protein [Crypthecodinium cohnii]